jgi:hypothetical protein
MTVLGDTRKRGRGLYIFVYKKSLRIIIYFGSHCFCAAFLLVCAFGVYISCACSGIAGFTYGAEVGDVIRPTCIEGDDVVCVCGCGFVAEYAGHGAVAE